MDLQSMQKVYKKARMNGSDGGGQSSEWRIIPRMIFHD
jgi:hypothetical protein